MMTTFLLVSLAAIFSAVIAHHYFKVREQNLYQPNRVVIEDLLRLELETLDLEAVVAAWDLERPFDCYNNPIARHLSAVVGCPVNTAYNCASVMFVCSIQLPAHIKDYLAREGVK